MLAESIRRVFQKLALFAKGGRITLMPSLGVWILPRSVQGGTAMRMAFCAAVLAAIFGSSSIAAGVARNANFSVYVPDTSTTGQAQRFAELLLERAEH